MRSSLPFCESSHGWFHLVMRDTVKVKCVHAPTCARLPMHVSAHTHYVKGSVCVHAPVPQLLLFGCICSVCACVGAVGSFGRACSCDGLFVGHRHKIIRLVVVCLSCVLSCPLSFVIQGGDEPSMAAV